MLIVNKSFVQGISYLTVEKLDQTSKPVAFVSHRLLENKYNEMPIAMLLADNGYFVICLDMVCHGERTESYDNEGSYNFTYVYRDIVETARDITKLIEYLEETSPMHKYRDITVIGSSIGASVALVAGYMENRIKRIGCLIGTYCWDYMLEHNVFRIFRTQINSKCQPDQTIMKKFIKNYNPIIHFKDSNLPEIIFLHGILDATVPKNVIEHFVDQMRALYKDKNVADRIILKFYEKTGHSVNTRMKQDLLQWCIK